ncbi:MAG TPA: hypothetical protein VF045_02355 [Acidimicrobiales bacterium]
MQRFASVLVALALLAWGCSSPEDFSGDISRTVRVDADFDEFAASMLAYFPQVVDVRPGDTIDFRQVWTGEPHSVTMGTLVDAAIKPVREIIRSGKVPDQPPPELEPALAVLPYLLGDNFRVNQSAGQPCYLDEGAPPLDQDTPCPGRTQPPFNGRQSYYSSGLIPYEGTGGNTYRVKLADDIAPGTYAFYCNYHGPLQSGEIVVHPKSTKVPSQATLDRRGRDELKQLADPLRKAYEDAKAGRATYMGQPVPGYLAGYLPGGEDMAMINEFLPGTIRTRVGEKVTWSFVGPHTVSFDVPPYFPQFILADDGFVTFNPQAYEAVGGPGFTLNQDPKAPPPEIDAGRWDGSGFISSGLLFQGTYSLTFERAGRYRYACLVHPRMVGEVVVS